MIVRLINKEEIWIPSPKLFFDILEVTKLEFASEEDKDIVINKLTEEMKADHNAWFFKIGIKFNVKSSNGPVPCDIRILKDRTNDDISGCIVFHTESDLADLNDFDYEFSKEDL